ncbi:alpha/beta hydrolase [Pedobacter vanadiisoli]|uniref:Alpha/beta hydrolase n=1 Tax=Pedobacter vanadiisoli TaxID=1761975 RepID=A0ABW5MS23_9SPHI
MNTTIKTLVYLYVLLTPVLVFSQSLLSLNGEITDTVKSPILHKDQQIIVRLPKSYDKHSAPCPVVYYFDAQYETLRNLVSANVDRLMWTKDIPDVITVGIVQWDRAHLSIEREGEKAKLFLNYIVDELIPYIKQKYQTADYRVFIGHSLGGQFVTYGMTQFPNLFNGVIAISPALFYPESEKWFKNATLKAVENFRKSTLSKPIRFYYCVGDSGFQDNQFKTGSFNLQALFKQNSQQNFFWHFDYLNRFSHSNSPNAGIPMGWVDIFNDWHFPELTAVDILLHNKGNALRALSEHKLKIKNSYGTTDLLIPKQFFWQSGKYCLEKRNDEDAGTIIQKFIKRDPKDPMPYSMMGDLPGKPAQL